MTPEEQRRLDTQTKVEAARRESTNLYKQSASAWLFEWPLPKTATTKNPVVEKSWSDKSVLNPWWWIPESEFLVWAQDKFWNLLNPWLKVVKNPWSDKSVLNSWWWIPKSEFLVWAQDQFWNLLQPKENLKVQQTRIEQDMLRQRWTEQLTWENRAYLDKLNLQRQQLEASWQRTKDTLARSLALRWGLRGSVWEWKMQEVQDIINQQISISEERLRTEHEMITESIGWGNEKRMQELQDKIDNINKQSTANIQWLLTWTETADELKQLWTHFWIDPLELALKSRQLNQATLKSEKDKELDRQKQEALNRDKAIDNMKALAEQWVELTADMAKVLFQWTWVTDYWNMALMANWIAKAKWDDKTEKIRQFNKEFELKKQEALKKNETTKQADIQKFDYYANLAKTNPELAQKFADMIWIDTSAYQPTSTQWQWNPDIIAKVEDIPNWQVYKYNPNDPYSWECWRFVNDVLWKPSFFWSSVEDKTKRINTQKPAIWSVAVFPSSYWNEYWHVAIVTWINDDWSIDVKESWYDRNWPVNLIWKKMWTVWERPNVNTKNVLGYYNPSFVDINPANVRAFVNTKTWIWTEKERSQTVKDILKEMQSWKAKTPAEAKKNLWIKTKEDYQVEENITSNLKAFEKDYQEITRAASTAKWLSTWESWVKDLWLIVSFLKTIDPWSVARESEVETVETARNYIDWINNFVNKAATWKKLTDTQRKEIVSAITELENRIKEVKFEKFIRWRKRLEERWVDSTITIDPYELNKLQSDLWDTSKIYEYFWIEPPEWIKKTNNLNPLNLRITIKKPKSDLLNLFK